MRITAATKISQILKSSPEALEAIVSLSPKFKKLQNPLLRRVMTPRVSIEEAAKLGGCSVSDFFDALQPLGFITSEVETIKKADEQAKPMWLMNLPGNRIKQLDVRPVLAEGNDPLKLILKEVRQLKKDEILCIVNTFEPVPLMKLLREKGFLSFAEHIVEGVDIRTYFLKKDDADTMLETVKEDAGDFDAQLSKYGNRIEETDVRELEMPQPMLTILEKVGTLAENHALFVHHKRIPVYLLPELEERGFSYAFKTEDENNVKMLIFRKG